MLDRPRQASQSAACGGGKNLAAVDGEVCPENGRTGGKGGMQDGTTLQRDGGRNLGGHPQNAPPVAVALTGGGLELLTN